jgi:hypothetical protein
MSNILDKIKALEAEKLELIEKRRTEIIKVLDKLGLLFCEDEYIIGALVKVKEAKDNDDKVYLKGLKDTSKPFLEKMFRRKPKQSTDQT